MPGTSAPNSATRRTGSRSAKCPIAIPPRPVATVATEYAAATSARGHANSAAIGWRNTATVPTAPNAIATIAVHTATISTAEFMKSVCAALRHRAWGAGPGSGAISA